MDWTTSVTVHESAFPEVTRNRILTGLKAGILDPALLYQGLGQTLRWKALHHAHSPAKTDAACAALYETAFRGAAGHCKGNVTHVVSLACGDGTKDAHCLRLLRESGRAVIYTPADISTEMALTAERTVAAAVPGMQSTPLVCDLAHCSVLPAILKSFDPSGAERLILFLGTIHNYWPPEVLRSILYPLRSQDQLLIGANLAPAADYNQALEKIRGQYENELTREWLLGALREINISERDGTLQFSLQTTREMTSLQRIQADFVFERDKDIPFFGENVCITVGQRLRVFFSHRFTQAHIRAFLIEAGLDIRQEWIATSGEEGLFLCRRGR